MNMNSKLSHENEVSAYMQRPVYELVGVVEIHCLGLELRFRKNRKAHHGHSLVI